MARGQIKQKQATIEQSKFESLCAIQCTKEEIAGVFNVSESTLYRWCKETYETDFDTIYRQKKETGKASLRRTQWKHAEKNPTMAIFLGKQYLGQKDVVETDNRHELVKVEELLNKLKDEAYK